MDIYEIWNAIDDQRTRTADLLEQLTDDEWNVASLCDGWTVRDVAAHLTLQQTGLWQGLTKGLPLFLRNSGDVNRVTLQWAKRKSASPKEQIIGDIRAMAGSRKHNLGLTPKETLIDILVHGQDIAVPLGRDLAIAPEAAAVAASQVWSCRNSWKSKVFKQFGFDAVSLTATDIDWSVGSGPEVRGPIVAILLLLTGRDAAIGQVSGLGLTSLRGLS